MTEQEFRNRYPPEVIELMLKRQEEQGNPKNIGPFLKNIDNGITHGGFNWAETIEGIIFWRDILLDGKFKNFYKLYPKKNSKILL
jgi:hypothetical protein